MKYHRNNFLKSFLFICFLVLLPFAEVYSQSNYEEKEEEEQFRINTLDNNALIQVVSKREERIGRAFGVVSVINRREIELFGANSLGEVLDRVVSSYLMSTYLFSDNQYSIRGDLNGHFNSRVIVLLNGRPTLGSSTEGIDFPLFKSFPLQAIERIEVQRGPGSVYHGSGAITGVINIVTRRPSETQEAIAEFGGGSFGTLTASMAGGRTNLSEKENPEKDQRISFYSAATINKKESWRPQIFSPGGTSHTIEGDFTDYGAFAELFYKGFSINSFFMKSDSNSFSDPSGPSVISSKIAGLKSFVNVGFQRELLENTVSDINITFVDDRVEENEITLIHSRDFFTEVSLRGKIGEEISYSLGGELKYFSGGEEGGSLFNKYGSFYFRFYQDAQYQFTEYFKGLVGFQANSYNGWENSKVTPILGLQMDLLPNISLKAVYAMGFRNPSHLERGVLGYHQFKEELIPEEIGTFQVQGLAQFDNLLLSTSFYFSRHSDRLIMEPDGQGGFYFANDDNDITSSGFEFEAKIAMYTNWYLTGSFAYLQNQLETDTPNLYWLNSTHSPEYITKFGIAHFVPDRFSIGIYLSRFSAPSQVDDLLWEDTFNPKPEGYTWATANFSYNLNKKIKLKGYLTNFLKEEVYYPEIATKSSRSIPGRPGPGAFFSLIFSFGWDD